METVLINLSSKIGDLLTEHQLTIATAESCTGGLLSHFLTSVSGSSNYFIGGIIAYSNHIKHKFLKVKSKTLEQYGAVSSQTAKEMAKGIRKRFKTYIGLSVSGIAGPTGGTPQKPVGLVWIGISTKQETQAVVCHFNGDRQEIKLKSVEKSLQLLLEILKEQLVIN